MKIEYDSAYDTLTITFATSKETVCFEDDGGVLYRVDPDKEKLLGVTILGFAHKSSKHGFDLSPYLTVQATERTRRECRRIPSDKPRTKLPGPGSATRKRKRQKTVPTRRYAIGVGGVLSEISLLSPDGGPHRVKRMVLLRGLQTRFKATPKEAREALAGAHMFGAVRYCKGWVESRNR